MTLQHLQEEGGGVAAEAASRDWEGSTVVRRVPEEEERGGGGWEKGIVRNIRQRDGVALCASAAVAAAAFDAC